MDETPRRRRSRERPPLATSIRTVVVAGASLAGLSAIEALRKAGYDGDIIAIGAEVAATCRKRGLEVDLVEALPAPLANSLGTQAGNWCSQLHLDHGVRLHSGVTVTGFEGSERVEALRLSDGQVLPADVVLMG